VLVLSAAVLVSRNRLGCSSWSNRKSAFHEPFEYEYEYEHEHEHEHEHEIRRMRQSLMNSHQQCWWFTISIIPPHYGGSRNLIDYYLS
jgi:hypothetical protein